MLVGHCGGAKDEELLFAGKAGGEGVGEIVADAGGEWNQRRHHLRSEKCAGGD